MLKVRQRLSYANVMSTIAVFLVLGGGAAFAATQLPKNSVGTKQLKKNAVATAKLKKNAVNAAKLRKNAVRTAKIRKSAVNTARLKNGAVSTSKIRDGAVTGSKIDAGSTPFSRVTDRLRNGSPFSLGPETATMAGTYTQPPGRNDQYVAAIDIIFDPGCTAPREAQVILLLNPANPSKPTVMDIAGVAAVQDTTGSQSSYRAQFSDFPGARGMQSFAPGASENHTFYLFSTGFECKAGSGASASNFGLDVIGTN